MFLEEYFMNLRIKGVLLSGLVFYNLQQLNKCLVRSAN